MAFGTEKTIELPKSEPCTDCSGSGAMPDGLETCKDCAGSGQLMVEQRTGNSVFRQVSFCSRCKGKGQIIKEACKTCGGQGLIEKKEKLVIDIPAGADTGYKIRVEGQGEKAGDIPGDLYIILHVERHPVFERHGDDIYVQKEINFTTAALGGKIVIPSLDGESELHIPEETQTGTVFRVDGKGILRLDGWGKGDEYVIVKVVTPTNLTPEERELLQQFGQLRENQKQEKGQPQKVVTAE